MQRDRGSNLCSRNRVRLQVRVEEKHLTEIKTQSYLNQGKRNDCVPFTRQSQNLENRNYPQRLSYRLKKKQGGNYSRCMSRFHHHTAEIRSKKTPRITSFAVFMIRSLSSWKKKYFFCRHYLYEQKIARLSWKLEYKDLMFVDNVEEIISPAKRKVSFSLLMKRKTSHLYINYS